MQPCPDLLPLTDAKAATLLDKIIEVSKMYYECAASKIRLVEAVKP